MKRFKIFSIISLMLILGVNGAAFAESDNLMIYKANKALELNPDDAKAYYNRGTAQLVLENYVEAVKDLTKSIELEPSADAYFNRGLAMRLGKNNAQAIEDFSKAIELFPDHWGYHFERANARIVTEDYEGAKADGSELVRLLPKEPESYFVRGLAAYLGGDLDAGLADANKALELKNWHKNALRLRDEILAQKKSVS